MKCVLLSFFLLLAGYCSGQKLSASTQRISAALQQKVRLLKEMDRIEVSVSLTTENESLVRQYRLVRVSSRPALYKAKLTSKEIAALLPQRDLVFINEYHFPKEELSTGAVDYTLNKVNWVRNAFPFINGDSLFLSVKERAFDTTDIDLKGRVFSSGLSASAQTSHASLMTTILAGGGNSSPIAAGVAPSAYVSSADFANLFPEPDLFYQQKKISVQNHSYGTVVESFYGNEAMAYDRSVTNIPALVHVFSAGNAGTAAPSNGSYAGIAGMANLTGNFKQSKNTISVTALDSSGQPMTAASRGPAFDGRVKPELAAYGEDGSSGAAALVSGAAALVQHAFRQLRGNLPDAALVKAVLLNSADEAGPAGIDYLTGYGSLNAYRAVLTVLQNRFWQNSLVQGETKTIPLPVPNNIARLKITLAWTDPAAQPGASKALVNDLDLVLRNTATGESWEPWVLNPKPNKDSLQQLPQRKKDTLNNVEQITVDLPTGGNYQIEVKGSRVTTAAQSFAVACQLDTSASFSWAYPLNGEVLFPAQASIIRWSTTMSGNASLEYSFDRNNWTPLASTVDLAANQYRWTVPDTMAIAFLRMNIGSNSFLTDSFVISPQLNLRVGFVCTDSFQLNWKKLPVSEYRLYRLGEKYLEPFLLVSDTAVVLSKAQSPSRYYSVAPVLQTKEGWRSNTIPVDAAGTDCYFLSFYLQSQTANSAFFTAELGTLHGVKELSLEKRTGNGFITVQTDRSLQNTLFHFSDSSLFKGENIYRLKLTLLSGAVLYSTTERVYYFAESPVYAYPNPVRQNEPIRIISSEPGRFTIRIINSSGREIYRQLLTSSPAFLPAHRFAKGLYYASVFDREGHTLTQKLVIY